MKSKKSRSNKTAIVRLIPAFSLALCTAMPAIGGGKPVLYLSFDTGFDGVDANGATVAATKVRFPGLTTGKKGNALKAGPLSGFVSFPASKVLNSSQGSVEMWVQAIDWNSSDNKFHIFMETRGKDGALYLYKFFDSPRMLMLSTQNADRGPYYVSGRTIKWQQGEWHHLAGSWSKNGIQFFWDGQPVSQVPIEAKLPATLTGPLKIGDEPWASVRGSSSAIDEVRVYDYPLSAREVASHYVGNFDTTVAVSADVTNLSFQLDTSKKIINAVLRTDGDSSVAAYNATFVLRRKGVAAIVEQRTAPITKGKAEVTLALPTANPGDYTIDATVSGGAEASFTKTAALVVPDLTWQSAAAPVAPAPIKPAPIPPPPAFVTSGLDVWGRKYKFGSGPLPTQISTQSKDLLTSPVVVTATTNGTEKNLTARLVTFYPQDATGKFTIGGTVTDPVTNSSLSVTSELAADGLLWITFKPAIGTDLTKFQKLSISIPISAEIGQLYHRAGKTGSENGMFRTGLLSDSSSSFKPFYWIGSDDVGLSWVAESGKGWPNFNNNDAIRIINSGATRSLVLNVLSTGQQLPKDWVFSFGLQATPIKALPKDWRKFRIAPAVRATHTSVWPTNQPDSFMYYGSPEPKDQAKFNASLEKIRKAGNEPMPYICPTWVSTGRPEWPFFKDQWATGVYDSQSSDVLRYNAAYAQVSPRAETWKNFILSKIKASVTDQKYTSIYADNAVLIGNYAPSTSLGFESGGKAYPEFPILGLRDLYTGVKAQLPINSKLLVHSSGTMVTPALAAADIYVDGEQYRGNVNTNYLDLFSLEQFRAEFSSRHWGLIPVFLPQFDAASARLPGPTRGMMALVLLHDVSVWPLWSNKEEVNRAFDALDQWGYVSADFFPYFDKTPFARAVSGNVKASAYRKTTGETLIIASNLTQIEETAKVCVDNVKFTNPGPPILWPAKTEVIQAGAGCFQVTIPASDYRMIQISPR